MKMEAPASPTKKTLLSATPIPKRLLQIHKAKKKKPNKKKPPFFLPFSLPQQLGQNNTFSTAIIIE
jgi:hypothetical protein